MTFDIGSRRVAAIHGDGLTEPRKRAALLHRAINHPFTAAVYRAIHPEVGLRIVDFLSPRLGDHTPDESRLVEAAARQVEWATRLLAAEPELGLVVMGHTHLPALAAPMPGRQYLNPGAWFDGFRYAVATERGAELRTFSAAAPPPPAPAAPR
jgi:UDP-2,3-diacylglucosamine pyrophosphatase LpxH